MKILLPLFGFAWLLLSSLLFSTSVHAQVCTGDSGITGDCTNSFNCPSPDIDPTATCPDPLVCCLPPTPPGGGTAGCSDACTTTADCLNIPIPLSCENYICADTAHNTCTPCHGTSGYYGSCLTESVCAGIGKNQKDGDCGGGYVCCTNAPSSDSCTLTAPGQVVSGAEFSIVLNSTETNTTYTVTTSPTTCSGSCLSNPVTDATGYKSCTLTCGPPNADYTITARHGAVSCSATVNAANIPGTPCTGNSGGAGWCHAGPFCISNTYPDGVGSCPPGPDINCCVTYPGGDDGVSLYCDSAYGRGFRTAIGCVNASDPKVLILQLTAMATRIATGITLLCILYAGFIFATSFGDKNRIAESRELLSNSLIYLLIIALAIILVNFLGVRVLNLNLFGFLV